MESYNNYLRQRKDVLLMSLSVCPLDYSKSYKQMLAKFLEGGAWPMEQLITIYILVVI